MSEVKVCLNCGKELVRRSNNEGPVLFASRKYCNRPCAIEHHKKLGHWRNYGTKLTQGAKCDA